ncbi:MAG: FAD-dependent oxidoreductase [Gammaproteobacteria bacterium]|nr:FAD-dependent oxidoreductase [Gammaproteobacteria bacterium]MCB1870653.1 FAD-dependent oxidoreductase [Gammaproteobacteria bacterium]MCB1881458.1 FAD-dependent oxidoreductase [Gammaproteobacteria bacterium]
MLENSTIILGGGLAGLAASVYSEAPIFEAEDHIGGVAASDTVDGFTFDRGIHILQTQNTSVINLLNDIGVDMLTHDRHAYIYSHETYTAYPFQVNTAGLPIGLRIKCLWDFINRGREQDPANYEEWMYRTIGKGFSETFLIPYSEKFWMVNPKEMTFEWTGNRVPKPNLLQVFRGALWSKQTKIGTNPTFRYPVAAAGYGAIAAAMQTKAGTINLQYRAERIDLRNKVVHFTNGEQVKYDTLISTIPLPELIRICPEAPDSIRAAASHLRTNSIKVVNLGIDRPNISPNHWVHFPEKDISFFRLSYPHNFSENVTPPGMSSISAEVSYSRSNPPDNEQLLQKVIKDLIKVKALEADAPVATTMVKDIPYAYCIYDKQRKSSIKVIHDWLSSVNVIPSGRYGLWTYFWSDEAILSGKRSAEKLLETRKAA